MSRSINIIIILAAVSLIFSGGCKEKTDDNSLPKEQPQEKSQPQETIIPDADPAPEKPVAEPVAEEVKPVVAAPAAVKVADVVEPVEYIHGGWMTDYQAAMKKAAAENKDMILDFTGSKWCPACIRLNEEVFTRKEFIKAASKDFVLVFLDYPRQEPLAPKLRAQNEKLSQMYGMEYLPTVFLTDAKGRPYGKTTYQEGGVEAYLKHLSELRKGKIKFDELMTKAKSAKLEDVEKAKLIDEAIRLMPPESVLKFYREDIDKIIALDSENKAGLRDRHKVNLAMWAASQQMNLGKVDKALEMIGKSIKEIDPKGQAAQEAYYFKALILDASADKAGARESLNKAIAADPESEMATRIEEILKLHFSEETPE